MQGYRFVNSRNSCAVSKRWKTVIIVIDEMSWEPQGGTGPGLVITRVKGLNSLVKWQIRLFELSSKGCFPEKHLLLLYWLCQSLWLCGSQQTVEHSSRDENTRPLYLSPEKPVCWSRSRSKSWTWNNRLVPNLERSKSRLYIVTLLI